MIPRKPTIYIAGPMRGYEDGNFPMDIDKKYCDDE